MKIQKLPYALTVCKVKNEENLHNTGRFYFSAVTGEEYSLVCETENTPRNTVAREDGWRCFKICGTLDFSLVGILSGISGILAENKIGIFAVSTFNTDYILVKDENFIRAGEVLSAAGYEII